MLITYPFASGGLSFTTKEVETWEKIRLVRSCAVHPREKQVPNGLSKVWRLTRKSSLVSKIDELKGAAERPASSRLDTRTEPGGGTHFAAFITEASTMSDSASAANTRAPGGSSSNAAARKAGQVRAIAMLSGLPL